MKSVSAAPYQVGFGDILAVSTCRGSFFVCSHWSLEFGNRRQALACIGYRLDQEWLFQWLASCLLTTAESKLGPGGRRFEDPFAQAALEIDLQEDARESE